MNHFLQKQPTDYFSSLNIRSLQGTRKDRIRQPEKNSTILSEKNLHKISEKRQQLESFSYELQKYRNIGI